jgi:PAS domain S-box-containing protein
MKSGSRRSPAEYLLLVVSILSAAVAVGLAVRTAPAEPVTWAATAVALALALATAAIALLARAAFAGLEAARVESARGVHALLSAIPEGIVVIEDGRIVSVNRRFCELVGCDRREIVGAEPPLPFWPPEHRHEIEAWLAALGERRSHAGELVLLGRDGARLVAQVSGGAIPSRDRRERFVLTFRDVSASRLRERRLAEVASRDVETALLNERGLEERLGETVRRALAEGMEASIVVGELGGSSAARGPGSADALAVERLRALMRAEDELARTGDGELVWILPGTDRDGAVEAVTRARAAISDLPVALTAGVSDLATAGDAPSLYALADRALADARKAGRGTTAFYVPAAAAGT